MLPQTPEDIRNNFYDLCLVVPDAKFYYGDQPIDQHEVLNYIDEIHNLSIKTNSNLNVSLYYMLDFQSLSIVHDFKVIPRWFVDKYLSEENVKFGNCKQCMKSVEDAE